MGIDNYGNNLNLSIFHFMIEMTGTNPDIPVLYEDNHLLIIDKPAGVLSQEDYSDDPDVLTLCKKYLKVKYNKPGNVFLGLVHRLDQPVSGVMVLAKTSKAAARLSEQIRNRTFIRSYLAFVSGVTAESGTLIHHLSKDRRTNTVRAYNSKKSGTKRAELHFKTIKQNTKYSLLEVNLITGRAHQIRVQLAKAGHPLWGDYKYDSNAGKPGKILGLRADELGFTHPTTKEQLTFTAPAPKGQPWDTFEY